MAEVNGAPNDLVERIRSEYLAYDRAAGTEKSGRSWSDSSQGPNFGCPDKQWEQYAETFAATDIDRMVMEESAKVSGPFFILYYASC